MLLNSTAYDPVTFSIQFKTDYSEQEEKEQETENQSRTFQQQMHNLYVSISLESSLNKGLIKKSIS